MPDKVLLDYNPDSKLVTYSAEEGDQSIIGYTQPIDTVMNLTTDLAKTDDHWNEGMKRSFVHAAIVPASIIMKMRIEDGVDFYDKNDTRKVLQLMDTKYSQFKTTTKKLARR